MRGCIWTRVRSFAVGIPLGVTVGSFTAYTVLYAYGSLSLPSLFLASLLLGPLVYWWFESTDRIVDCILIISVAALVTILGILVVPLIVMENPTSLDLNLLVFLQLPYMLVVLVLALLLLVLGIILTASVYQRNYVPNSIAQHRGQTTRVLVFVTVLFFLFAAALGVSLAGNYGTTFLQEETETTIEDVTYDSHDKELYIVVAVPNRLSSELLIESYHLEIKPTGTEEDPIYERGPVETSVPAGDFYTFEVIVDVTPMLERVDAPIEITITGYAKIHAFNDYNVRHPVASSNITISSTDSERVTLAE